ncbi:MAG: HlyC/CorC family transporter [Eubacterium sp.]|nr:HlyC/CorC family transporter [Eubacterium sp.]
MDSGSVIQLIILILLLLLSGIFSSMETALTTVNLNKLRALQEEGGRKGKKAARVLKLRENPSRLLTAVLIGNNVVNLSASALTTIFVARLFNSTMIGVGTGILTFLVLLFGEIVPKSLAALYSLPMSLFYSGPAYMLSLILSPLIWVLNKISRGIFRLFRIDPDVNPDQMTESELRMIVDVSHEEGVIEKEEQEMITNVVDFGDAVARDIMVPRADMTTAQITAGYDELLKQLRQDNYSRIPIYEDSRDHIVGILHVKDLILYAERHGKENVDISRIMRKPVYVYEYQRTTQIFKDMKASSTTMCIVLDEYGITAGLITTEDLIEEIVGDIRDEYDASEAERIIKRPDGSYDVDGGMKLDDLKDALDVPFESEYYDSVGGLMIELLDRHPMEGDEVENDVASFRAIKVEKNRPSRVLIRVKKKPVEEENGGE